MFAIGRPVAAALQSILDYIVVANGVRLDKDDGSFVKLIQESKDRIMRFNARMNELNSQSMHIGKLKEEVDRCYGKASKRSVIEELEPDWKRASRQCREPLEGHPRGTFLPPHAHPLWELQLIL